ncbi:increased DNA methylation 1-like [Impatiens glandulifera]|uniref:increased DNA methylation 1-like n=1 Tax=Impatiens glandulifera TaxID=253017 RepID=UPI001FB0CF94|nr:increased DNA methylation 1-like [Impatiens glandulifera]
MLLGREIENLHDDGFDGSINEHHIFSQIFLGSNSQKASKRCLVTGVINFESDQGKPRANSAVISHGHSFNPKDYSNENLGAGSFPKGYALTMQNGVGVNGKRMKISGKKSSSNTENSAKGCQTVTCRLVESSSQGVSSSSFLLKRHSGYDSEDDNINSDPVKRGSSSLDTSNRKEINASSSVTVPSKSGSHQCTKNIKKKSSAAKRYLGAVMTSLSKDSTNDPRSVLRHHVQEFLRAVGWEIGRRDRQDKVLGEYLYFSPDGRRPIREFSRVWNLCGEKLLADGGVVAHKSDIRQWNDIDQFRIDLADTLKRVKEEFASAETSAALARCWLLLDPFANLVFIDKKLGNIKSGKLVKEKRSPLFNKYAKKISEGVNNNALPVFGENYLMDDEQCSDGVSLKTCHDISISVSRENNLCLLDSPIFKDTSCKRRISPNQRLFSAVTFGSPLDHSEISLYDVPITETDRFSHGSSLTCERLKSDITEETILQMENNHSRDCLGKSDNHTFLKPFSTNVTKITPNAECSKIYKFNNVTNGVPKNLCVQKRSAKCQSEDDDLLISAIIKNKSFRSIPIHSTPQKPSTKSKSLKKRKGNKGSCRLLLRSIGKNGKYTEEKWYMFSTRTILSWLIGSRIVSLNDVVQYRDPKDGGVLKVGLITHDGIFCYCCSKVLSLSKFKMHAGLRSNYPSLNLFMEYGKPFTLCQLEAWSAEYKARKPVIRTVHDEVMDQNDDSCGMCGDVGELICCDNCPSTFHHPCLNIQELPEGSWYCSRCTCRTCGDLVDMTLESPGELKCSQCEHKYHRTCFKGESVYKEMAYDTWFCGQSCQEVYSGLHTLIGCAKFLSDGFSWTLLRCIHEEQKVHSDQRIIALKAECNSKLAVALTIMEECFLPMVDPLTGIDMIPHLVYSWGSEFARLDYRGFYTATLEMDDIVTAVASIRVHGVRVAEMPLIATCSRYRRQGMCRRLMDCIEKMLKSLKVEKLVISAIPSLLETWVNGFGFQLMEDSERRSLSDVNLMVFPGTLWMKKHIHNTETDYLQAGSCSLSSPEAKGSPQIMVDCQTSLEPSCEKQALRECCGNDKELTTISVVEGELMVVDDEEDGCGDRELPPSSEKIEESCNFQDNAEFCMETNI